MIFCSAFLQNKTYLHVVQTVIFIHGSYVARKEKMDYNLEWPIIPNANCPCRIRMFDFPFPYEIYKSGQNILFRIN